MAGIQVKVFDKFAINSVQVGALNTKQRQPDGMLAVDVLDSEGTHVYGVSMTPAGVRDLITALEYALLYQAGEV